MGGMDTQKAQLYAPNLPWNCYKPEEIGPVVMQYVNDHEPFFRRWAQVWYENFQFLFGNQNVRWSRRYGFAVDYDFLKVDSPWGMRANTNLSRVVTEALGAYIFGQLPEWEVETTDESSIKGKRYRKIVQKILDAYMTRLLCEKEFGVAAINYVMFGQFGAEISWKRLAGQLLEIPRFIKNQAPIYSTYMAPNAVTGGLIEIPTQMVDAMGKPMFEDRWDPVLDAMGRQIIDKLFAGDVGIDILTPFELRREIGTYGMHKTRYVQRFKLMDYDAFMDEYKDTPGATQFFKTVRPVYSDPTIYSMAIRHFMRMQFTSPPSLDDGGRRVGNMFKSSLFKYKVFVVEHFDKPNPDKWPYGRRLVIANGECTHITKPNYSTNKLDGWHPFVEAQWMTVNPNSIAAGPMNDVIRKNKEVNVKDSLIATAVRRNMGSQLLIQTGSGIDPQRISGEPGMAHEVNNINGARYLNDEVPIPPVISRLREMDKDDIYETSGAMEALRGEPSSGATSGYQEKLREEREEKRLYPARKSFEFGISGIGEKLIACLRGNVKKLDDSVMGFLKRSAAGEFSTQDVVAFLSNSIDFGIDIKVTKSSMAVKSNASHQATVQELSQGALGQRLQNDAKVLDNYLKIFGAEELRDASSAHRDRANRENEVFLDVVRLGANAEGITKPIVLFEDDDNIHIAEHTDCWIKNIEEFRGNEQYMTDFIAHMEHHRLQIQEKASTLPPGTSLQTVPMMQMAMQQPTPTVQTVLMQNQQMNAQRQGATTGKKPPQAPKLPSGGPAKGGNIDPGAPAANTPTADISQGGI